MRLTPDLKREEKVVLIPVSVAARMLSISSELLYREIRENRFPSRRIGKRILVSRQYVESLAEVPRE
jgi:excisionase family DNA binding protein